MSFQECDCKHPHFITKYSLKKSHRSLLKKNQCPPTEAVIRTLYSDLNIKTPRILYASDRAGKNDYEKTKQFTTKIRKFIKNGFGDSKEDLQLMEPERLDYLKYNFIN